MSDDKYAWTKEAGERVDRDLHDSLEAILMALRIGVPIPAEAKALHEDACRRSREIRKTFRPRIHDLRAATLAEGDKPGAENILGKLDILEKWLDEMEARDP